MKLREIRIASQHATLSPGNKCSSCTGSKCCAYVMQQIDTPRTKKDFSILLWQVSHENVHACREDEAWYLLFESRCMHLLPDGRCGIYETRPQICRDHSNDCCELDGPREDGFDLYFHTYDALLEYCRKKFKNWDKKMGAEKSGKKGKKKKS